MLSSMLMGTLPLTISIGIIVMPIASGVAKLWQAATFFPAIASIIVSGIAYLLNRTGHYRPAAGLYVFIFIAAPLATVTADTSPTNIPIAMLTVGGVLLAATLFPRQNVDILSASAAAGGILLLPVLVPGTTFEAIAAVLSSTVTLSVLILIFARFRDWLERRRQAELVHQADQSKALHRISKVLTASLELGEITRAIIPVVGDLITEYDAIMLALLDDEQDPRVFRYEKGRQEVFTEQRGVGDHPLHETATGSVLLAGKPLIRRDLPLEATFAFDQRSLDLGRRSQVFVPLLTKEGAIGTLYIASNRPYQYGQAEVFLLEQVAAILAVAIRNAELYATVQHYATELEARVAGRTRELEVANQHLQALSRLKDEFVSNVSHELRTPISNLKLHHTLISGRPEKFEVYLGTLQRETGRLERIIEDLLRLSRLDQARMDMYFTQVDLNTLVEQFVADRLLLAQSHGLALAVDPQPDLPLVQADESMLVQTLSILFTNALNFTPSGGQVTVSTQTQQWQKKLWSGFSVTDTGPGIPRNEQKQLFERFFRGKAGRNSGEPGTGLGLAIARAIVNQHNGRIEIESEGVPGRETRFSVWLPV